MNIRRYLVDCESPVASTINRISPLYGREKFVECESYRAIKHRPLACVGAGEGICRRKPAAITVSPRMITAGHPTGGFTPGKYACGGACGLLVDIKRPPEPRFSGGLVAY